MKLSRPLFDAGLLTTNPPNGLRMLPIADKSVHEPQQLKDPDGNRTEISQRPDLVAGTKQD